jgi:hypothetical protein
MTYPHKELDDAVATLLAEIEKSKRMYDACAKTHDAMLDRWTALRTAASCRSELVCSVITTVLDAVTYDGTAPDWQPVVDHVRDLRVERDQLATEVEHLSHGANAAMTANGRYTISVPELHAQRDAALALAEQRRSEYLDVVDALAPETRDSKHAVEIARNLRKERDEVRMLLDEAVALTSDLHGIGLDAWRTEVKKALGET